MIRFSTRQPIYGQVLLYLFAFAILITSCVPATPSQVLQVEERHAEPISLVFAGDAMHHMPQYYAAYDYATHTPDYTPSFQYIEPIIKAADLAVCNLETPIAGRPYAGYPQFSTPKEYLNALDNTGFNVFQLANNHILDRGKWGLEQTIANIKEADLFSIGAYVDEEHKNRSYPLYFEIKGVKLAFLNYTYGLNGLRAVAPNTVNKLDSVQIEHDFRLIEQEMADLIVVLVHWGDEYKLHANENQKQWADFLIRKGADLIVGSHPHVVQEVDLIANEDRLVPVFYSLGNLISNQQNPNTNGGILAKIEIDPKHKLISKVQYHPFYLYKGELNSKYQYYILSTLDYLNNEVNYKIPSRDSILIEKYHTSLLERMKQIKIAQ